MCSFFVRAGFPLSTYASASGHLACTSSRLHVSAQLQAARIPSVPIAFASSNTIQRAQFLLKSCFPRRNKLVVAHGEESGHYCRSSCSNLVTYGWLSWLVLSRTSAHLQKRSQVVHDILQFYCSLGADPCRWTLNFTHALATGRVDRAAARCLLAVAPTQAPAPGRVDHHKRGLRSWCPNSDVFFGECNVWQHARSPSIPAKTFRTYLPAPCF